MTSIAKIASFIHRHNGCHYPIEAHEDPESDALIFHCPKCYNRSQEERDSSIEHTITITLISMVNVNEDANSD